MPGLTTSLQIATQALMAQQGAISITSNNIANVNTEGYSREQVLLSESDPVEEGNLLYGNGVTLNGFASVRDRLLDMRIMQETQDQGYTDAQVSALNQIQTLFSSTTSGIGAKLSEFFDKLQALSDSPASTEDRSAILTAAGNLATAFHQTVSTLSDIKSNLNLQVTQDVNSINNLMDQIAALNVQVAQAEAQGNDPGVLADQRTKLMTQLSKLVDVSVVQTEQGETVTTANGMGLVVGSKSFHLDTVTDASGLVHVYAQGQEITSQLSKGELGGTLEIRDKYIPELLSKVDELAGDLASSFNDVHTDGYDLNGDKGVNLFSGNSASTLDVAITDPRKIAAAGSLDPVTGKVAAGNIDNLKKLIGIRNDGLPTSGDTPESFYSSLVFDVGNATSQAKSDQSTAELSLSQLKAQRSALSGVSINEETANLLRYQHAFQAAARVVSVVDQLTQTVLNIGA